MHWGDYGWGWGMGFGWVFMVLFSIIVIAVIVFIVKAVTAGERRKEGSESAIDILKRRYAKGEISKEDFDRMEDDLLNH